MFFVNSIVKAPNKWWFITDLYCISKAMHTCLNIVKSQQNKASWSMANKWSGYWMAFTLIVVLLFCHFTPSSDYTWDGQRIACAPLSHFRVGSQAHAPTAFCKVYFVSKDIGFNFCCSVLLLRLPKLLPGKRGLWILFLCFITSPLTFVIS